MTESTVGRVVGLFRYPVKSMTGETLETADVGARGIVGDRAYALIDRDTGRVVSAKRPRKWPRILDFEARLDGPGVRITTPDGNVVSTENPDDLDRVLSEALGTGVGLEGDAPEGASFEYHWPDMEGLVHEGRTYRDEITAHEMPAGTFFDGSTLHIVTTGSLEHLRRLEPGSDFNARRFRPNVLIETPPEPSGFIENEWVGRTLSIGEVRVEIPKRCLRCVMVTLEQHDLPKDPGVLRAAFAHNEGNVGVKGAVLHPGVIRVGDAVALV